MKIRTLLVLTVTAGLLTAFLVFSAAKEITITEFLVPTVGSPSQITAGPDHNLWFTEVFGNKIGRITPKGEIKEFPLPHADSKPLGIAAGPDGNLWFTETGTYVVNRIGRITPDGVITEFPTSANSQPQFITAGPDGNLWFTEIAPSGDKIGRMTPAGVITGEWVLSTPDGWPMGISVGPDGALWFTEYSANKIGRIAPGTSTAITGEWDVPTLNSGPSAITAGPCPSPPTCDLNLWFTESVANKIGRINQAAKIDGEWTVPTLNSGPRGITAGPDGNLWFTEFAGKVGSITRTGVMIGEWVTPTPNSRPVGITVGPDGNLWFTEGSGNKIGKISLQGGGGSDRGDCLAECADNYQACISDGHTLKSQCLKQFHACVARCRSPRTLSPCRNIVSAEFHQFSKLDLIPAQFHLEFPRQVLAWTSAGWKTQLAP